MLTRSILFAALFLGACGTPVDAVDDSGGPPAMPPPPCWDSAGDPLPDDVCAARAGYTAPVEEMSGGGGETLPPPPGMPTD